jgi:hypothetical protein
VNGVIVLLIHGADEFEVANGVTFGFLWTEEGDGSLRRYRRASSGFTSSNKTEWRSGRLTWARRAVTQIPTYRTSQQSLIASISHTISVHHGISSLFVRISIQRLFAF